MKEGKKKKEEEERKGEGREGKKEGNSINGKQGK